ncbi:MAG TPA: glycosyltransferase, partial [Desulfobacteraceae bacterium]|nr:glycosyltransferase [Desulfobacteraceae bacterium]
MRNPVKTDISIIIPVINEQATVNQAIEQLRKQDFQGVVEIVVVDGGRDHATIRAIEDGTVVK